MTAWKNWICVSTNCSLRHRAVAERAEVRAGPEGVDARLERGDRATHSDLRGGEVQPRRAPGAEGQSRERTPCRSPLARRPARRATRCGCTRRTSTAKHATEAGRAGREALAAGAQVGPPARASSGPARTAGARAATAPRSTSGEGPCCPTVDTRPGGSTRPVGSGLRSTPALRIRRRGARRPRGSAASCATARRSRRRAFPRRSRASPGCKPLHARITSPCAPRIAATYAYRHARSDGGIGEDARHPPAQHLPRDARAAVLGQDLPVRPVDRAHRAPADADVAVHADHAARRRGRRRAPRGTADRGRASRRSGW